MGAVRSEPQNGADQSLGRRCLIWEGELDRLILIASAEGVWGDRPQNKIRCEGGEGGGGCGGRGG